MQARRPDPGTLVGGKRYLPIRQALMDGRIWCCRTDAVLAIKAALNHIESALVLLGVRGSWLVARGSCTEYTPLGLGL